MILCKYMINTHNILVLNCGSSSLRYDLFRFDESEQSMSLAKGVIEKIGRPESTIKHGSEKGTIEESCEAKDHEAAFAIMIRFLCDKEHGVITDVDEIEAVGHRVVHGGEHYSEPVLIDEKVIATIREMIPLAPLHNPAHLIGIELMSKLVKDVDQVAVFDTAFHQTMPDYAYLYALPLEIYKTYKIRRYGFHGTSHYYVSRRAAQLLGKSVKEMNMITCHLGNGASITAVEKGKSIDTSMGFTPLEGLMMGTRCGSVDPAIVNYLITKGKGTEQINEIINKESGLLGISGVSNDMRDIIKVSRDEYKGESAHLKERSLLALKMYAHVAAKHIGGFMTVLRGVDMIVFTAGVGQYGTEMRKRICDLFSFMGVELDEEKNEQATQEECIISTDRSEIKIAVVPTNEELQIAKDTCHLIKKTRA